MIDFLDYTPAATGMQITSIFNPVALTVDGVPDAWTPGAGVSGMDGWEQIDGLQGGLSTVHEYVTNNFDPTYTTAYRDEATPPTTCGGDSPLTARLVSRPALNSTDEAAGMQRVCLCLHRFFQRHWGPPTDIDVLFALLSREPMEGNSIEELSRHE